MLNGYIINNINQNNSFCRDCLVDVFFSETKVILLKYRFTHKKANKQTTRTTTKNINYNNNSKINNNKKTSTWKITTIPK
jgi:hypothetical protein